MEGLKKQAEKEKSDNRKIGNGVKYKEKENNGGEGRRKSNIIGAVGMVDRM